MAQVRPLIISASSAERAGRGVSVMGVGYTNGVCAKKREPLYIRVRIGSTVNTRIVTAE